MAGRGVLSYTMGGVVISAGGTFSLTKLPLVAVRWDDAHADSVQQIDESNVYQFHKPHVIITFGLLVREDDNGVTVVMEDIGDGDLRGPTFIPHSLVQEMWLVSANPYRRRKIKNDNTTNSNTKGATATP